MHIYAIRYSLTDLTAHKIRKGQTPDTDLNITRRDARVQKHNIIGYVGEENHKKIQDIKNAPYIMYAHGNISLLDKPLLGIVGPRRMTDYAKRILTDLFFDLKGKNLCTVSGFADGVDWYAHHLSLAHDIPTIAVLGGGLRYFMKTKPARYNHIIDNGGLILSEFPVDKATAPYTFPQRNRIIAGLSDLLFVPEAAQKSGTLITINSAIEQNKKIYAIPNDIYTTSHAGLNPLFASGDIVPIFDIPTRVNDNFHKTKQEDLFKNNDGLHSQSSLPHSTDLVSLSDHEKTILSALDSGEQSLTKLQSITKLSHDDLLVAISLLDMQGMIHEIYPGVYQR